MSEHLHTERLVLHTAMHRASALMDLPLLPLHFQSEQHGAIWETILALDGEGKPSDYVSVFERLERTHNKSLGVLAMNIGSANDLYPAAKPSYYAGLLVTAWRDREALQIARTLAAASSAREEGAVDRAIAALMALHAEQRECEYTARQAMSAAYRQVVAANEAGGALVGIPTGLADLDEVLGGLHDSDLIVIGARPAMGKTGLLLGMIDAASHSHAVGLISGEQPYEQVGLRWMAAEAKVPVGRLRNARLESEEWPRLGEAAKSWNDRAVRIYDRSAPDIADVIRVARRWKHQHGIKALYVDYLQKLEIHSEAKAPKHERIGMIARALKNLARDLQIPVIALAQVNRKVEERQNQRPMMSDLADSSEIEKEADQIMTLWRDQSNPQARTQPAEVNVVKNRHGNTGTVECLWMGEHTRFVNTVPVDAPRGTVIGFDARAARAQN